MSNERFVIDIGHPLSLTGDQVFSGPREKLATTQLKYYESSPGTFRSFCGHCGTHLSFFQPSTMSGIVDIVLGTVDRAVLEQQWMMPDRQCWCDLTIPWVKALTEGGEWDKMAQHPTGDYNEYC